MTAYQVKDDATIDMASGFAGRNSEVGQINLSHCRKTTAGGLKPLVE
jgi:hypothetical protein